MNEIPVTILSGPLGAGKTTVVNYLLHNSGGRSIAVLVNDMGEINVDAELLSAGTEIAADGGVAELSNGCICCELQDDLETEVARLATEREFEYLVVESSGISEPEPVARLFTTDSRAAAAYTLDTTVTVVDTARFLETFGGEERIERETAPGSEDRPLSDLLVEQIEFADVILLNKTDLVDDDARSRATELVANFAPRATVLTTTHGEADPGEILGTGLFDPAETGADVGWSGAVEDHADHDHGSHADHDHAHPDEVYGVTSFIYSRRRPFHPRRIRDLLGSLPPSVVRSKGLFWVAGREETAFVLGQAGPNSRVEAFGPWLASLPTVERDLYRSNRSEVEWHDEHGDRRTELVFIGQDIDQETLVERLDDCLVTDDEWNETSESGLFPDGDDILEFSSRDSGSVSGEH